MSKVRILVVEDEVVIAMEIERSIKNFGCEVISVVNSSGKALAKAENDRPDLILMDTRIQGEKDGIETIRIEANSGKRFESNPGDGLVCC